MLTIKNVSKRFGEIVALQDISFDVSDGEFVFLTGPSGAGKTTLLKLILRHGIPDTGEIVLDGTDITKIKSKDVPHVRQQIGTVFQDFKVLPERTVRENIEVALAVIGLPKSEWRARVNHVLELVELSNRSELFPSQLSGGELQRVSMARALVVNPKIILADEPTGNLDWDTSERIMVLFDHINKEGKTIIMATHNQQIIDKMKKRVIEIKDGTVNKLDDTKQKKSKKVNTKEDETEDTPTEAK
jgi:cell division transport system ATP-binding protein